MSEGAPQSSTGKLSLLVGWTFVVIAIAQVPVFLFALGIEDHVRVTAFGLSAIFSLFAGSGLIISFRNLAVRESRRAILFFPLAAWVLAPAAAALPFVLSGEISGPWRAYYEAVGALTTTGASVLDAPGDLSMPLRVWRAILSWLGGLATVVIAVAIFSVHNIGGLTFLKASLPHGEGASLQERVTGTALPLLPIYALLTALCVLFLWLTGLSFGDALLSGSGIISTNGLEGSAVLADGMSPGTGIVFGVFMLAGCINLTLWWQAFHGRPNRLFRDAETVSLLVIALLASLLLSSAYLFYDMPDLGRRIASSLFMAFGALSTTGLADPWADNPYIWTVLTLLLLAFLGGSSGSTAGGFKVMRFIILLRHSNLELSRLAHPHLVKPLRFSGRVVSEKDLEAIWLTTFGFVLLIAFTVLFFSLTGLHYRTALIIAVTSLSNAAPLAPVIDPSFAGHGVLTAGQQAASAFLMIAGRLELSILLAVLTTSFWKN